MFIYNGGGLVKSAGRTIETIGGENGWLTLTVSHGHYFFLAYFMESSATARMMMPPLMMNCQ